MSDDGRLKITLEDLGEPEKPAQPEASSGARAQAEKLGRQAADTVKSTAQKATDKVAGKAAEVTSRSAEAARDKVAETIEAQAKATADAVEARIRQIDWKGEAQKGATGGLKWLSNQLGGLAEKITPGDAPDGSPGGPAKDEPKKDKPAA